MVPFYYKSSLCCRKWYDLHLHIDLAQHRTGSLEIWRMWCRLQGSKHYVNNYFMILLLVTDMLSEVNIFKASKRRFPFWIPGQGTLTSIGTILFDTSILIITILHMWNLKTRFSSRGRTKSLSELVLQQGRHLKMYWRVFEYWYCHNRCCPICVGIPSFSFREQQFLNRFDLGLYSFGI